MAARTRRRVMHGVRSRKRLHPDASLYQTWRNMRRRCQDPNNKDWPNYGARGIYVCEAWDQCFVTFRAAIPPRPSPAHTLDRIDVNGPYAPGNVRWSTLSEQARNRRPRLKAAA